MNAEHEARYEWEKPALKIVVGIKDHLLPTMDEEDGGWILGRILDLCDEVRKAERLRAEALAPSVTQKQEREQDTRGHTREMFGDLQSSASQGGGVSAPAPNLTFAQFSAVSRERCESPDGFKHRLDSWSTSDWFLATLGELGEAANNAKKLNRYRDGIPGNNESEAALRDKLRKELGDTYVYLDLLAQSVGVDIGAAAVEVFNAKSEELGCPIRMQSAALDASPSSGGVVRTPAMKETEQVKDADTRVGSASVSDRPYNQP